MENKENEEKKIKEVKEGQNQSKKVKKKNIIKYIVLLMVGIILLIIIWFGIDIYLSATTQILKPIIYLYPTEETQVNVQLGYKEKITCSYPKYTTGWNVIAQPNGDLKDIDTNKNLYSLYYESDNVVEFKVEKDGFIVKGEDSAEFLEEKLKILGLTDRETEEFIIYWLPKLEANKYNYIRFATKEEIEANMPLTITPTPDTTIRILMEYKGLENPIEVEEQNLEKTERKGFVAVEWGGTEIK